MVDISHAADDSERNEHTFVTQEILLTMQVTQKACQVLRPLSELRVDILNELVYNLWRRWQFFDGGADNVSEVWQGLRIRLRVNAAIETIDNPPPGFFNYLIFVTGEVRCAYPICPARQIRTCIK